MKKFFLEYAFIYFQNTFAYLLYNDVSRDPVGSFDWCNPRNDNYFEIIRGKYFVRFSQYGLLMV